jgi:hypothetical protein
MVGISSPLLVLLLLDLVLPDLLSKLGLADHLVVVLENVFFSDTVVILDQLLDSSVLSAVDADLPNVQLFDVSLQ